MADSDNHEELSSEINKRSEDEGVGQGEGEGSPEEGGGEGKSEEELYTLLFYKVDSDGSGHVTVDSLVDYLHQMQVGLPKSRVTGQEEVYDSQEDVSHQKPELELSDSGCLYNRFTKWCTICSCSRPCWRYGHFDCYSLLRTVVLCR